MNQILIHNGNNNYKLPHIGKLKIEKAFGSKISIRLPCRALIDGGALDCQYITTFMFNGKFIVVFTASRRRRRRPSSSITPSPSPSPSSVTLSPSPTTKSSSIRVIVVAVAVRHRRRCPSASSPLPLLSDITVVDHPRHRRRRRHCCLPSLLSSIRDIAVIVTVRHCRRCHRPHPPSRHGHQSFSPLILFYCYVKKSCPRSRRVPMKPH